MEKRDGLKPTVFDDAVSDDPAVREWAEKCADRTASSLLVLGSHWSGKTHTMHAALQEALALGVDARSVAIPQAIDFTAEEAGRVLSSSQVVLVDPQIGRTLSTATT